MKVGRRGCRKGDGWGWMGRKGKAFVVLKGLGGLDLDLRPRCWVFGAGGRYSE